MIKKIILAVACVAIVVMIGFFAVTFSEFKLKNELSKGSYESPYIERTLEGITINGISVEEYCVFTTALQENDLYTNAKKTLCNQLYKTCGKKPTESKENSEQKSFIIEEDLNENDTFTLRVENGNVYIKGSEKVGISRGIKAFVDEVILKADGVFEFSDGYEYKKVFFNYVKYEDFGAVGDGKADDFDAIIKTHEFANEKGFSVFADESAVYYIGKADKTAIIMTDTSWSTAHFIIDDKNVENRSSWVFAVSPSGESVNITEAVLPIKTEATNIGTTLEAESLVVLTDSNKKHYIRKGANQNSGSSQTDIIVVDKNGNISEETPLIWDFDAITEATAYPIDSKEICINGGIFTTLANEEPSEYNYYSRGIVVRRSNTIIDGVYHIIENEGETGAPYSAFISVSNCVDVKVQNCTFTGHKKYFTTGSAGSSVAMGTYDIGAARAVNLSFRNCNQTNDITDIDYWGIAGTNYCKNLVYDGCAFSRFDAHQGVLNATIKNSVLGHHGIKLIGNGTAIIENTTVLSDSFIDLRSDYGSTWEGDLVIKNCEYYPKGFSNHIIKAENSEDHDFGYTCYLPQSVVVEGFKAHKVGACYLFTEVNKKHNSDSYKAEHQVVVPQKVTVKSFSSIAFGKLRLSKNDEMFKECNYANEQ